MNNIKASIAHAPTVKYMKFSPFLSLVNLDLKKEWHIVAAHFTAVGISGVVLVPKE